MSLNYIFVLLNWYSPQIIEFIVTSMVVNTFYQSSRFCLSIGNINIPADQI